MSLQGRPKGERRSGQHEGAPANAVELQPGDVLLVVDIQHDFIAGSLSVPRGGEVVPVLNRYLALFTARGLPVIATRDWHPADHCSFRAQGGPWPVHCVAGTLGAAWDPALALPAGVAIVSKATARDREAYSAFAGTDLAERLRALGVARLFIGGLALDYCVLHTTRDALALGYRVCVLADAVRAVDVQPGDGARARDALRAAGAAEATLADFGVA
jgi:nicotinamidase/pyrazinamidase